MTPVCDELPRPTTPKCPQPSVGTTHWTASRGVPIEPRRHWHALDRSTRSRDPRNRAGRRKVHAIPDSARASVGRYELLRTTEGQGWHQGLSVQSLSCSIGAGCDTRPSSVLPGTRSPRRRQGSSLHPIVKRRIPLRSFGSFARRLGALFATPYTNKTIVRGSEASTSKQGGRYGTLQTTLRWGAVLDFVVDNIHPSPIRTDRLLATTSGCLQFRFRSPGQHDSRHR